MPPPVPPPPPPPRLSPAAVKTLQGHLSQRKPKTKRGASLWGRAIGAAARSPTPEKSAKVPAINTPSPKKTKAGSSSSSSSASAHRTSSPQPKKEKFSSRSGPSAAEQQKKKLARTAKKVKAKGVPPSIDAIEMACSPAPSAAKKGKDTMADATIALLDPDKLSCVQKRAARPQKRTARPRVATPPQVAISLATPPKRTARPRVATPAQVATSFATPPVELAPSAVPVFLDMPSSPDKPCKQTDDAPVQAPGLKDQAKPANGSEVATPPPAKGWGLWKRVVRRNSDPDPQKKSDQELPPSETGASDKPSPETGPEVGKLRQDTKAAQAPDLKAQPANGSDVATPPKASGWGLWRSVVAKVGRSEQPKAGQAECDSESDTDESSSSFEGALHTYDSDHHHDAHKAHMYGHRYTSGDQLRLQDTAGATAEGVGDMPTVKIRRRQLSIKDRPPRSIRKRTSLGAEKRRLTRRHALKEIMLRLDKMELNFLEKLDKLDKRIAKTETWITTQV